MKIKKLSMQTALALALAAVLDLVWVRPVNLQEIALALMDAQANVLYAWAVAVMVVTVYVLMTATVVALEVALGIVKVAVLADVMVVTTLVMVVPDLV